MRRTRGGAFGLVLAAGVLFSGLAGGCQIAGFVVEALERVPAAYEPEDRRTVVMVDDPNGELPDARSRGVIAQRIARRRRVFLAQGRRDGVLRRKRRARR